MAWGMSDTVQNALQDAAKKLSHEVWQKFMENTIDLDAKLDNDKPIGWHWFWGLYYLYNSSDALNQPKIFNIATIRAKLPDEHWLKEINDDDIKDMCYDINNRVGLKTETSNLLRQLRLAKFSTEDRINFDHRKFDAPINFSSFIFPTHVSFEHTEFSGDTNFSNAVFLQDAIFNNATFFNAVNFQNTQFHGVRAKFRDATFEKIADFTKAAFKHYANFKDSTFNGRAIFKQADFELHAPRFFGAKFNNEMIFNRIELPEAKRDKKNEIFLKNTKLSEAENAAKNECVEKYQKRVEENESAYGTLVYLMEKQNKSQEKHLFFREEMRWQQLENHLIGKRFTIDLIPKKDDWCVSWRRTKIRCKWLENYSTIIFFRLYSGLSDYGYGVGRAFMAWISHILLGFFAILAIYIFTCWGSYESLFCSLSVSFANANPFVFAIINDGKLMECYEELNILSPMIFGIIRGSQTMFGIVILFLLLTTLRVRFRINNTASNTTINLPSEK